MRSEIAGESPGEATFSATQYSDTASGSIGAKYALRPAPDSGLPMEPDAAVQLTIASLRPDQTALV